ncbi:hypothetical protein MSAN_01893300 [Mycena sanguinolenta]|uniref:DUF6535 domain-containing protein n=1 Tax=Mycena sanguinolenta TaxID=230812 RepID=A0A8H6XRT7_9AGAR|nr:hypothetical protein MSAN_01893300 [Mycena sanguinolenta]
MSHESPPVPLSDSRGNLGFDAPQGDIPICPPDNDKLIATLQSCFSDLLRRQDDLLQKQDNIQKAVEALKPPPVTDKKTKFWNSYMKLADEHDKELKEKYSTDLDTSLIFSGLFSAVASAFIIQIQPQLAAPTTVIVVAQALLYMSLFIALLAALLAFLGKQWIMQYQAAGSKGTIEQRGLERQHKLDGMRKWNFDLVLQMFPLFLQLALLLFSTALSVYLWTVHLSIAIVVLVLISFGFIAYLFLLGSAMLFQDSPFQTPLAHTLSKVSRYRQSRDRDFACVLIMRRCFFLLDFRDPHACAHDARLPRQRQPHPPSPSPQPAPPAVTALRRSPTPTSPPPSPALTAALGIAWRTCRRDRSLVGGISGRACKHSFAVLPPHIPGDVIDAIDDVPTLYWLETEDSASIPAHYPRTNFYQLSSLSLSRHVELTLSGASCGPGKTWIGAACPKAAALVDVIVQDLVRPMFARKRAVGAGQAWASPAWEGQNLAKTIQRFDSSWYLRVSCNGIARPFDVRCTSRV